MTEQNLPSSYSHESFLENCEDVTLAKKSEYRLSKDSLLEGLHQIEFTRALLEATKVKVALRRIGQKHTSFDKSTNTIFVHPLSTFADAILGVVADLRRAYRGCWLDKLPCLDYDSVILVSRMDEADIFAHQARFTQEWFLKNREQLRDSCGSGGDFRDLSNGAYLGGALETWFITESAQLKEFDKKVVSGFLAGNYVLPPIDTPASTTYVCQSILDLTTVPPGRYGIGDCSYIGRWVSPLKLLQDPAFTEIRDRSTSNFWWFIRFERSMAAAEKQLT